MGKKKKKGKARVLRVFELWEWKGSASKEAVRSHKSHIGLRWILGPWVPKKISSLHPLPPFASLHKFLKNMAVTEWDKIQSLLAAYTARNQDLRGQKFPISTEKKLLQGFRCLSTSPRSWPSTLAPRRESRDVQVASDQEAVGLPLGQEFPGSY